MMFRYYITDTNLGGIVGTHSLEVAENYAQSEDYFVVDTGTGEWLTSSAGRLEVGEADSSDLDSDDTDDGFEDGDDDDIDDLDDDDEDK